ncbi:hypothetical protein BDZ89DRAFT_279117 [Hymenopellis radicata]|nr:hypothetical protein BDZ89DRAFT_279117 [Hymenopellis radicata]
MTYTPFSLCDTASLVTSAVAALQNATHLVVDCEGIDLGRQGGRLALLSVLALPSTPYSGGVSYLFDVLSLDNEALASIFALLSSSSYTKIMFDGRMDYAALFHEHGVELQNVLDLQLAEVSCRTVSASENQRKVARYLAYQNAFRQSTSSGVNYAKLRMLAGLGMCVRVYGASSEPDGGKADFNHSLWLRRPLPPQYLEYAAKDVVLIDKLYHAFVRRGFVTAALSGQSQRYISLFKGGKPLPGRCSFDSHPFLPLDILDYKTNTPSKMCAGCERSMSVECFQGHAKHCFVCAAMLVKMNK